MRKLTTSVDSVLSDLMDIIVIEKYNIHKNKLSITWKYHLFEVVTFEIFVFEGHKYEGIDCSNWRCASGPQKYTFHRNKLYS